jgi:hypothetical protein
MMFAHASAFPASHLARSLRKSSLSWKQSSGYACWPPAKAVHEPLHALRPTLHADDEPLQACNEVLYPCIGPLHACNEASYACS